MPKHKKTWILVKGCEYKPGGCISLGQILTKPFEPSIPLLPDGPITIPEIDIERSHQIGVKMGSRTSLGGSFQLWAEADLLPVSGNTGGKVNISQDETWEFERLEGEITVPKLVNVKEAMAKDEIVAQIRRNRFSFRKRLYMVTGVRVARGARLCQNNSKTVGANAKTLVDLTAVSAVPLKVGPEVNVSTEKSHSYSFQGASDFVYAYRVCEVYYGKDVYVKPYNKGETSGVSEGASEESEDDSEEVEEERVLVEKIADSDYAGANVAHQTFTLDPLGDKDEDEEEEFIMASEPSTKPFL
jgi:hypothetical protein